MAEQHRGVDFFVSYTAVDRAWAEWIAWQLEGAGYGTVVQDWDFRPGENLAGQPARGHPLVELVRLARLRWRVEHDYRELKDALAWTTSRGAASRAGTTTSRWSRSRMAF